MGTVTRQPTILCNSVATIHAKVNKTQTARSDKSVSDNAWPIEMAKAITSNLQTFCFSFTGGTFGQSALTRLADEWPMAR